MKSVTTTFALIVAFACGIACGGESQSEQQKYFKFWRPHAGQWTISITEAGKKDISGSFSYRPSPTKLCYTSRGHDDDGTPVIDGLYGYDSGRKCWVDVEILKIDDSYVFRTVLLRADVDEKLRKGTKVSLEVSESVDGETIQYTATRVYEVVQKDKIIMLHQNRKTTEGKVLPDLTVTVERKK